MDIFISVLLVKILRFILKIVGKGSSFPGQLILKLFPNILTKIKLPEHVIAVTGSNGKTSTAELIYNVLTDYGCKVAYNYEGSNQIEGATTLILNDCSFSGVCKSDVILLEVDERYAEKIFKNIVPTHLIVTNILRDQQTRNGNREWVYNCIRRAINKNTTLILNADDPLVSLLSECSDKVIYYGIDKIKDDRDYQIYDDGAYCPKCGHKLLYDYRHFDYLGEFLCSNCGHKKQETDHHITKLDLDEARVFIDDQEMYLSFPSIYNAYNNLAAYSLGIELGADKKDILKTLNNYVLKNRRITVFKLGGKDGIFLASKHENPVSYNQSMTFIANHKKDTSLIIVVDRISRKYFTSETSWLWDIDFDILCSNNIKNVIISGTYSYDLALRLEYSNVDQNKIIICPDIKEGIDRLSKVDTDNVFVVTCFADQDNVLGKVAQHG